MPERFLLQILRILVTHGILRSTRGVDGGYALIKPPDQISLLEVIEAIDGPLQADELVSPQEMPESAESKLQTALSQVTRTARQQLQAIKLSQLLAPPELPPTEEKSPAAAADPTLQPPDVLHASGEAETRTDEPAA